VLYILALPFLFYLSFLPKYKQSIPARFFSFSPFQKENGIWFHVCSLGEARALKPLLQHLDNQDIKITTITQTGYEEAKKYTAEVRYLPYEMFLPFWIKKQKVLVVLEAEFWYMLFLTASLQGTKIILLNARISDNSVNKYLKFRWFYQKILQNVSIIYAQSEIDKKRFLALGAKNIEVIGNIKLANDIKITHHYQKPSCEVITAGSTHETEEEIILQAFLQYIKKFDAKLIIAPRHPERFQKVYELIQDYAKKANCSFHKFSSQKDFCSDIILIDMLGELNNIYAISDIAILGGAFKKDVGGHNPLEPAHFHCKIITGKHFFHQKELFKYVKNVQYVAPNELYDALLQTKKLPPSIVEETINLQPIIQNLKDL